MNIFGYEILKKASKPNPKLDVEFNDNRVPEMMILPWESRNTAPTPTDFGGLVNQYRSWVYVCANKNANAVANSNLKLYATKSNNKQKFLVKTKAVSHKTQEFINAKPHLQPFIRKAAGFDEVLEHPFYDLIKNVNPLNNRFDLWEQTQIFLELTGNAYWFIIKDNLGVPMEIWNVPSQYITIAVDKARLIVGYLFKRSTYTVPFDFNEIIHFKFSSPNNQLYGSGPLAAVLDTVGFDTSIRRFESTMMNNMGRPEAVIETEQVIGPDVFRRFKEEWAQNYAGAGRVGKTIVLEQGLKYKPITMIPKDMNYQEARKLNREEIAAIFGMPLSKLTTEAINLANAEVGEAQYQKDTVEPRLRRLEEKINERLMPLYADNLFCSFDSTVPQDTKFAQAERESRLRTYMTSINEERAKDGLDPVEWGDIPLAPPGVAPLGSPQQTAGNQNPLPPEYPNDGQAKEFINDVINKIRERLKIQGNIQNNMV